MNVFFDVDDTLITWDVRMRPGVEEVFQQLRGEGHVVYLWSGYGPRWPFVDRFNLREHIEDCFWKPLHNHHARLEELGVPFAPDYVVDDHPQIVAAFGGTLVEPAKAPFDGDREMWRAYEEIVAFAREFGGRG